MEAMMKYFRIFKNSLASALEYRAGLVTMLMFEVINVTAVFLLWTFVFQNRSELNGLSFGQILLYYLITPFIGVLTGVNISDGLGEDIKNGKLSLNLLQPFQIWLGRFCNALATKIYYFVFITPIYLSVLLIYLLSNQNQLISLGGILISLIFVLLAFVLHFFMDLALAFTAFWIDDVWSFRHVKEIFFGIFGGQTFPFNFLSSNLRKIFEFLPFKFFYYVPVAYLLGTRATDFIINDVLTVFIWTGFFVLVSFSLWKLGLRRYEAFGN